MPIKTRGLRQIAPESSPESSAKSLSRKFFGVPFSVPDVIPTLVFNRIRGDFGCDFASTLRCQIASNVLTIKGRQTGGGFKRGGVSRSGLVLPFLSFFVLFGTFPNFPGFSRFARGWSGDFPDSSLFSFSAYFRGVPRASATKKIQSG